MAARKTEVEPVPGPEAFDRHSADARLSQAALILSVGAAVAGEPERIETHEEFPLPPVSRLHRKGRVDVAEAAGPLRVDTSEYVKGEVGMIPPEEASRVAHRLYDDPAPEMAAALIEAGLHSPDRLIRTASAAAALDTTGPRPEVFSVLQESASAREENTRDIARTALAKVAPQNPRLARLVTKPAPTKRREDPSSTAVLSHGTFAANAQWWRPGGDFYTFLDQLQPSLPMHTESFRWSGVYSHEGRLLAADQLTTWLAAQNLTRPDFFAHSHGVTVANLATQSGLSLDRLVMLAWPVHTDWLPDLNRVNRVISFRVRLDLVIIVDGGAQSLTPGLGGQVQEHVHGWFRHSAPHEPEYWRRHDLASHL
ncbi:MAG TPA: hypothetical protein VJR05_07020 [Acidimicrobiia bacterium]|nr:hypothetical protein [Acidimicrobiia bacterium]